MKRVLVFTTAYRPAIGGAEVALEQIIKRTGEERIFIVLTYRMDSAWAKHEFVDGVEIWRLGWGTFLDRLFIFPLLVFWKARSLSRAQRYDLFWGMMVSYASIGAYLCKLFGTRVPLLLTLQEGDAEAHLRYGKFGLLGFWWKRLIKSADYIQAISAHLADRAVELGARGRVVIVPNGVDIERFSRLPDVSVQERYRKFFKIVPGQRVMATVSRLVVKNAVDTIIRAIGLLPQEYRLLIVGDGPQRKWLQSLVSGLGVDARVTFLGSLSQGELPDLLHMASVFVRPSRSEGQGISFLESMAAGLPLVATRVGGIADFLEDGRTGLVVRVDDPTDLADKIKKLFSEPVLYQSIHDQAFELVKARYSWDAIGEQMTTVFTEAELQTPNI